MEDQVVIKDLLLRGIVGINEWERERKQDILVNLVLFTDLQKAGESDDVADSVNYRTLAKQVIELVEGAKRFTVEALAADIAGLCVKAPGVNRARVRVEKPGALRFARSVGVEIERSAADGKT
jgi:FolB domain-containing protein